MKTLKKLQKQKTKKMEPTDNNQQEQSFIEHLEALRSMLIKSIASVALLSPAGFYLAPKFINFLIKTSIPEGISKLHYFSPMEVFIIQLKAGIILAFVIAFPYIISQVKIFVFPALYEHERKFFNRTIFLATILFLSGNLFCIFLILPLIMNFSLAFATTNLEPTLGLANFINLAGAMMLAFGLMFQFPLIVLAGVKFGLIKVATLEKARPYIIVGILILAAIFTPPDVVSQLMLGVPTWLLFEAGLYCAKFLEKKSDES